MACNTLINRCGQAIVCGLKIYVIFLNSSRFIRMKCLLALGLSTALISATTSASSEPSWQKTEVFLGMRSESGDLIEANEFRNFLKGVVTPIFPNGLTVIEAYGQMRQNDGQVTHQPTSILIIVSPKSTAATQQMRTVIRDYKARFGNPQVMRLISTIQTPTFYNDK